MRLCVFDDWAEDAPGCGDRPRSAGDEQFRADLRWAMEAGEPVDEIVDALIVPLERSRNGGPPWTPSFSVPEISGPVG
jgi:hypothetical protein